MSDGPLWECPECEHENDLDSSVVTLCVEVWETCDACGSRYSIDVRGKEA